VPPLAVRGVERRAPRHAAQWAAVYFGLGLMVGGFGLLLRQPFPVFIGMGAIGGVGCGLGYISPVLAQASPMMQDMFGRTPLQAAAVVSLISLFNAGGRLMWASASDYIGRRNTYAIFFVVQVLLFLLIPRFAARGQWMLFQGSLFVIFTMYGGGFATIPAFLADIFGPQNVGAIHGALLTAWSAAAIAGPVIITELSNSAKAALAPGASRVGIYDTPLQVLAMLLAVGFVLTQLVRPLKHQENVSGGDPYARKPAPVRPRPKRRSGAIAVAEPED